MIQNKKGVSDVISTVLIILLVLAAVGIVGAIVLRSVGQSSQQIDAGTICASTYFEVTSCDTSDGSAVLKRLSTGGNNPTLIEVVNGATLVPVTASLPSDGSQYTVGGLVNPTSLYLKATFGTTECSSAAKACVP